MRNESMDFVTGALLIIFLSASTARAHPDLKRPLSTAALDQFLIRKDPIRDLDSSRPILAPRMFNWSLCSIANNNSESITNEWPLQLTQDPARLDHFCSRGCNDDDAEEDTLGANFIAGATVVYRDVANSAWSVCVPLSGEYLDERAKATPKAIKQM
jgi:hypothetical protein